MDWIPVLFLLSGHDRNCFVLLILRLKNAEGKRLMYKIQ